MNWLKSLFKPKWEAAVFESWSEASKKLAYWVALGHECTVELKVKYRIERIVIKRKL